MRRRAKDTVRLIDVAVTVGQVGLNTIHRRTCGLAKCGPAKRLVLTQIHQQTLLIEAVAFERIAGNRPGDEELARPDPVAYRLLQRHALPMFQIPALPDHVPARLQETPTVAEIRGLMENRINA